MRFPRFLRRFLIGYMILHVLAAILFVVVLSRMTRTQMINAAKGQMEAMASMLQAHISDLPDRLNDPSIVDHVKRLGKETEFRFTVISGGGVVLADSDTGKKDIGPHGNRPEIIEAQSSGVGFKQRFSKTLQIPMMYLAIQFAPKTSASEDESVDENVRSDSVGYIRLAAPAVSINNSISAIQKYILLFTLGVSLLTALLMLIFSARAMQPLQLFSDSARKIGEGHFDAIPTLHERDDEWQTLGLAFTQMRGRT